MNFTDLKLHKSLQKSLAELNYTTPTVIQEKTFSAVMSGRDIVGIAQTGTGKTLAYLLPCITQWRFSKEPHPQIIILVPTRELVQQVVREAEKICGYLNIIVDGVYGGANINTQHDRISQGVDLLVATPGRLRDLALKGSVRFKNVKRLVIDEVDEMLTLGFRPQLTRLFELFPDKRQNLMYSATLTADVEAIINEYFNLPMRIEAAPTGTPLDSINQSAYRLPNFNTKLNLLDHIMKENQSFNKVLIFTISRRMAELLYSKLEPLFPEQVGIIHSNKSQNNRFASVKRFHDGETRILIATDLIARGIDIIEVSHVINFDLPEPAEVYMHRIGRTGRADKKGDAISFITPKEDEQLKAIETLMNMEIPKLEIPEDVPVSTELIDAEKDILLSPNIELKVPSIREGGGAFHEKKEIKLQKKKKKKAIKKFVRTPKHDKGRSKSKRR